MISYFTEHSTCVIALCRNPLTRHSMKEQKRSSKTIDIVSYALKVSVNGVTCVCSPFQVKNTFKICELLTSTCPSKL